LNKKILRLAIPNILSNLTVPLLSSVDTAIMGHLPNPAYIGAIAIGSMIFNFLYWGFGFLRMGTTGLAAQSYGENNRSETISILVRAILVGLFFALAFIIAKKWIGEVAFSLVNGSREVENYAMIYFNIRIFAAPATLSLYAFYGWFLGVQNAKFPLYLSIIINLLNISLNYIFVYKFNMTVDGIAYATVISQYAGLLIAFVFILTSYRKYLRKIKFQSVLVFSRIKKFFTVNFDIFIRTLFLIFTFSYFTILSADFGDKILAANSILIQLWMILSYGVDGFAFAAESLTGKFIGERNKEKLSKLIKYIFYWGMGQGVLLSIIFLFDIKGIIKLYTNQINIINTAMEYAFWTILAPVINSVCFIWDGIFIGATATKAMRNSMLFATLIIFLPVFYLTQNFLNNNALWLAMIMFMFARGITLTWYSKRYIFKVFNTG